MPVRSQRFGQLRDFIERILVRLQIRQLAADMHIDSDNLQPFQVRRFGVNFTCFGNRNSEFILGFSCRNLGMCLGIHIRVHPHRNRGHFAQR